MPQDAALPERLYHLALREDWEAAVRAGGPYSRSTLGKSLADEGFIHCSFAHQVQFIADVVYKGRADVALLTIDPSLLPEEVRLEKPDDSDELFPHIYGPLPLEAVVAVDHAPNNPDGTLNTEPFLREG